VATFRENPPIALSEQLKRPGSNLTKPADADGDTVNHGALRVAVVEDDASTVLRAAPMIVVCTVALLCAVRILLSAADGRPYWSQTPPKWRARWIDTVKKSPARIVPRSKRTVRRTHWTGRGRPHSAEMTGILRQQIGQHQLVAGGCPRLPTPSV